MEEKKNPEELQLTEIAGDTAALRESEAEFDLDDIMREFASQPEEAQEPKEEAQASEEAEVPEEQLPAEEAAEEQPAPSATRDTVRLDIPQGTQMGIDAGDTSRFAAIGDGEEEEEEPPAEEAPAVPEKAEPYSEGWEPEFEQPIADYVPAPPILFRSRSKAQELKRKLVTGPERRYYELSEQGLGRTQAAVFFSLLIAIFSAVCMGMFAMGAIAEERLKLMVFCQFLALLLSALLGCYRMMEGIGDLFRGRFSLNTMLVLTFVACLADGLLGLQEQRIPCCAAFSLQVTMSLWSNYHIRYTKLGQTDTLRKASILRSVQAVPDYYDGCKGLVRGEGRVEDFMEHYEQLSAPQKKLHLYALIASGVSIAIAVAAGVLQQSISFGLQVLSVTLLAAMPVTGFVFITRPTAILEKRMHRLGAVLCGWQGVESLSGRAVFALRHSDLFPMGNCKLNGVKFYSNRDPDEVVAFCTALVEADGGSLAPLFRHLLDSRNGRHYDLENLTVYPEGGIGGEVLTVPVLMGTGDFLRQMGVEIPEGILVDQAVYAAIDGELSGVFAVTYTRTRPATAGMHTLSAYRGLRGVFVTDDFMLTEDFIRSCFRVNTRRFCFPDRVVRSRLRETEGDEAIAAGALTTVDSLATYAYAVTGARSLRSAGRIGLFIHIIGGSLGMAMMLVLGILGAGDLLTPVNVLLYELAWLIPGLLITEWTRSI